MLANLSQSININFEGYKTVFSKKFEKFLESKTSEITEKEALRDSFTKIVETKMNDKYKLGEGSFNNVYKIDDYYVFRLNKLSSKMVDTPTKYIYPKYNNFVDFKSYNGNVIAMFGEFEILKNVKGTSKNVTNAGMPYDMIMAYRNSRALDEMSCMSNKLVTKVEEPYVSANTKKIVEQMGEYYNSVYLPKFSKLPQKAYDNVVSDFVKLNNPQNGYWLPEAFDCYNPNNFIQVGKKIKIIDELRDTLKDGDISDVMFVFLRDYGTPITPSSQKMKREIFDKCMVAAVKNDFTRGAIRLKKTLKFVGIEKPIEEFAQDIKLISQEPKEKQVNKIKKYLEELK